MLYRETSAQSPHLGTKFGSRFRSGLPLSPHLGTKFRSRFNVKMPQTCMKLKDYESVIIKNKKYS
jgi:hypothetical protein